MIKEIEFNNKCGCSVDYSLLDKAMKWYGNGTAQHSKKCIFLNQSYPAVTIGSEKIRIHRLLMMYQGKRRLENDKLVHHKDKNKLNAQVENLQIVGASEHRTMHNLGSTKSEATRKKISESMKRYW